MRHWGRPARCAPPPMRTPALAGARLPTPCEERMPKYDAVLLRGFDCRSHCAAISLPARMCDQVFGWAARDVVAGFRSLSCSAAGQLDVQIPANGARRPKCSYSKPLIHRSRFAAPREGCMPSHMPACSCRLSSDVRPPNMTMKTISNKDKRIGQSRWMYGKVKMLSQDG